MPGAKGSKSNKTGSMNLRRIVIVLLYCLATPAVAAEPIPVVEFTVNGFEVSGDNPLSADETAAILQDYTGTYAGLDGLLAATDALQQALNAAGFAFRRAILPPQTLNEGVVKLEVVAITVAKVEVEGNQHFSADNILASVPGVRTGLSPSRGDLSAALELANRHPSKHVSVRLRESDSNDAVDAVIAVKDRRPWTVFAGLNNIGTRDTGRTRVTVGGQYTNLFNRDHSLTASYTTSPENASDVMQAGASYELPIYRANGKLSAFFSESDVDVGEVAGFQVSGAGRFWGLSFTRLLARQGGYSHEWSLGIQDRLFESSIDFIAGGIAIPVGNNVRSHPVTLGYRGKFEAEQFVTEFGVAYSRNIGIGDRNSDNAYRFSRTGADSDWDVLRFDGAFNYFLPRNWLARVQMNGQWTNEALVSGEQFGLGGERSIRGLNERSVLGDSGFRIGVEMWTPQIPYTFGLRALAFVDLGMLDRADVQPGEVNTDTVASAGLGLRYQWRSNLSINLDYARTIAEGEGATAAADDAYGARWHFNIFYTY